MKTIGQLYSRSVLQRVRALLKSGRTIHQVAVDTGVAHGIVGIQYRLSRIAAGRTLHDDCQLRGFRSGSRSWRTSIDENRVDLVDLFADPNRTLRPRGGRHADAG